MSGGSQASLSPEKITGVINYWWVTSECGTFCKMGEIVTGDVPDVSQIFQWMYE